MKGRADARAFLIADRRLHDAIVHDALRGGEPPFHLMSREFFELASRRLRPGGLMIVNYQGPISGPGAAVIRSLELTLREAFPHVALCVQERPGSEGSVILAGCRQAWEPYWPKCPGYVGVDTLLDGGEAVVLTDSRNPVPLWWARYALGGR